MADTKISALTDGTTAQATDAIPVARSGVNYYITPGYIGTTLLGSTSLTGTTVTTSQPVLNLSQTWNAGAVTFTGLKFNATDTASASGSLLLDLQVGGASKFSVNKAGSIIVPAATYSVVNFGVSSTEGWNLISNGAYYMRAGVSTVGISSSSLMLASAARLEWSLGNPGANGADLALTRAAAATLQLGAADAAAPVAQTLQVQSVVAGTSNTAGANWTLKGSAGTGTGAGGSIIFQVASAGSSGTAQNAYATALTIDSTKKATFAGTLTVPLGSSSAPFIDNGNQTGFYSPSAYVIDVVGGSGSIARFGLTYFVVADTGYLGFGGSGLNSSDTRLYRDAANTLALRNGATAQTYRIYATTDSPVTNFQRLTLSAGVTANMAIVAADNGGTGIAMGLQFGAALTTGGGVTNIMNINTSGHLVWNTDNTYDIGASGANRPRNVYLGSAIIASGSGAGLQIVNGASYTYVYPTYVSTTGDYKFYNNSGTITFGASSDIILSRSAAGVLKVAGASSAGGTVLHNGYTFSTLPTGAAGMVAYISDASNAAPAFGDTVSAGGGTTKVLCWYNGTNWTVIGK